MANQIKSTAPFVAYGRGIPNQSIFPDPVIINRPPTTNDQGTLGQIWIDPSATKPYILSSIISGVKNWVSIADTSNITIEGEIGNATGSTINIFGTADQITTTGDNVNTITIAIPTDPILDGTVTTTGTFALPETTPTTGQIILGGYPFMHSYGGALNSDNVFIGPNSGNFTFDITIDPINGANTAVGDWTLNKMDGTLFGEAQFNTTIGTFGLSECVTGGFNTALGALSMVNLVSGEGNTAIGAGCLANLVSGSYNTICGWHSGFNYNGSESSNIIIGYTHGGTVGESNVLRIGIDSGTGPGELDEAYIAGIYNRVVDATSTVVLCDVNNKVGGLPDGNFGDVLTQGLTGPEWQPGGGSTMIINPQITDYTLELTDNGSMITMDVGIANTLTVPNDISVAFPIGAELLVQQLGVGQTTIAGEVGVVFKSASGLVNLYTQNSVAALVKIAADTWTLFGDLA